MKAICLISFSWSHEVKMYFILEFRFILVWFDTVRYCFRFDQINMHAVCVLYCRYSLLLFLLLSSGFVSFRFISIRSTFCQNNSIVDTKQKFIIISTHQIHTTLRFAIFLSSFSHWFHLNLFAHFVSILSPFLCHCVCICVLIWCFSMGCIQYTHYGL